MMKQFVSMSLFLFLLFQECKKVGYFWLLRAEKIAMTALDFDICFVCFLLTAL